MKKTIAILAICAALSGCGDNPFADNSKIKDTEYAQIRIEMQRCTHVASEGSFTASMRFSPVSSCLNHLKTRIINTGKATANPELDLED